MDRLFVDEAHYFKNLFYVSKMTRIAGAAQTASQRAFDMFLKVLHLQRMNRGGGVVFATGTPIANSVAEMYTDAAVSPNGCPEGIKGGPFRFLGGHLRRTGDGDGIGAGRVRLPPQHPVRPFINVPELMQQFRQVADIQTQAMLQLPVPELGSGKPTVVSAPCSPELKAIVEALVDRAEALRAGD